MAKSGKKWQKVGFWVVLGVPNAGKVGFQELTWRGHGGSLWDLNFGFGHIGGSVRPDLAPWVAMWEKGSILGRQGGSKVGLLEGQKSGKKVAKSQKTALLALLGTFGENPDFDRKKGSKKSKKTPFFHREFCFSPTG